MKLTNGEQALFMKIADLIEENKRFAVSQINSSLTLMFWQIGRLINSAILQNKRADYGKQIVVTLSRQLCEKYGKNLKRKTYAECSNLLISLPMKRLSLHCHDN